MASRIVPETPEAEYSRRRSRRQSTIASSLASASVLRQIAGTPQSQDDRTKISESPFSTPALTDDENRLPKTSFHPMFLKNKGKQNDASFEEFVPATQDPGNHVAASPKTKVQAWLNQDQTPTPIAKRRRRSSVQSISKYLTERPRSSKIAESSSEDYELELAKIKAQDQNEHVPYRPPSFQDYSTDSAKALLEQYEAGAIANDDAKSVRKTRSLESTCSVKPVRKTRSLEHKNSSTPTEAKPLLDTVVAYVEVRSKNENRSDVVIGQLVSLGAKVESKLTAKCTHVIFKEGSLTTYNKAKKLGLPIVSVNWIEACKKAQHIAPEGDYPPMNQDKYDSPGLFPKLRKTKSLQPKSDEEFSKLMDAKAKRIMKKKMAESPNLLEATPKTSPKVPRRRRSQILDTLKEYEEQERCSPVVATPASPCSSEELNTPLLKRIAKRLFKANQEAATDSESPVSKAIELEISNDGFEQSSQPSKSPKKRPNKSPKKSPVKSPVKAVLAEIPVKSIENQSPKAKPKSVASLNKKTPVSSATQGKPRKSMSKDDNVKDPPPPKTSKKKKLFTQHSILSVTPLNTPPDQQEVKVTKKKGKGRTQIVKKGSLIIAQQPPRPLATTQSQSQKAKENIEPVFKAPPPSTTVASKSRKTRVLNSGRRSSVDFKSASIKSNKSSMLLSVAKELVLTSCSTEDQDLALKISKTLPGKATVALQVRPSTTHVIAGEERRTLNMLRGLLRGCWILDKSWLLASLEAGGWVDEEPYELVTFSAAVKARRLERGADFKCQLLHELGPIFIGKYCKVPRKELADMVQLAGGQIVNQLRLAKIVLGHPALERNDDQVVQVTEKWLLDSLQQFCPLPFVDYLNT